MSDSLITDAWVDLTWTMNTHSHSSIKLKWHEWVPLKAGVGLGLEPHELEAETFIKAGVGLGLNDWSEMKIMTAYMIKCFSKWNDADECLLWINIWWWLLLLKYN